MAGTLFEATNLPLKCWCLGLYLVAQNKDGLSTLNLGRPLGIAQNSAWLMTHTFMHAMLEAENCQPLGERVEIDDAYWGVSAAAENAGAGQVPLSCRGGHHRRRPSASQPMQSARRLSQEHHGPLGRAAVEE